MEKFKKYLPLINELLEDYSGTIENEKLWSLGTEDEEVSIMHDLHIYNLNNICAKLEAIKIFIEQGILPGDDSNDTIGEYSYLLYYISNIISLECKAKRHDNVLNLHGLFSDVLTLSREMIGE